MQDPYLNALVLAIKSQHHCKKCSKVFKTLPWNIVPIKIIKILKDTTLDQ